MVLWLLGWSTNFQMPIFLKPSNSSLEAWSHFSLSDEFIASQLELGATWNMCIKMLLILSVEGPAWLPLSSLSLVGWSEFWGVWGWNGAVSMPGKVLIVLLGVGGGARDTPWGKDGWNNGAGCPDPDWSGLGGLVGGWARLTKSSPNESGGYSMVLKLTVSTSFLSQGIEFLWISHHGKFQSVSELHPRTCIPWILVPNWWRSFLSC